MEFAPPAFEIAPLNLPSHSLPDATKNLLDFEQQIHQGVRLYVSKGLNNANKIFSQWVCYLGCSVEGVHTLYLWEQQSVSCRSIIALPCNLIVNVRKIFEKTDIIVAVELDVLKLDSKSEDSIYYFKFNTTDESHAFYSFIQMCFKLHTYYFGEESFISDMSSSDRSSISSSNRPSFLDGGRPSSLKSLFGSMKKDNDDEDSS